MYGKHDLNNCLNIFKRIILTIILCLIVWIAYNMILLSSTSTYIWQGGLCGNDGDEMFIWITWFAAKFRDIFRLAAALVYN